MGKRWLVVAMIGMLAGCGGESDPTQAFCVGFGNGGAVQWTSCTNCAPLNPTNAGDRNLSTDTGVVPNGGATTETFVITATSVNPIAGGVVLGAWVTQPSTISDFSTNFETFLDGTPVESLVLTGPDANGVVLGADEGTPAQGFIGMQTAEAFDEVRFTRTNSWSSGADPVYRVYEVCSDGGAE